MNWLDYLVLFGSLAAITIYGIWHTRKKQNLETYLKGNDHTPWYAIGISVMATQASAITFLSTPGQGYLSGLGFVQIYFGVPIALLIIGLFFLPNFHKLHVYTAYEYLQTRFDSKTRLLGAGLFLLQRGLGAGLTVYAPAIVLTTVFGWSLSATIIACGLVVMIYTMLGGSEAVTETQKYQLGVIFAGMVTAACLLVSKLPPGLTPQDTFALADNFQKLNAINLSCNPDERYTLWSGLIGGTFLMLSYFGADQSQVQRYMAGSDLRNSRLGLAFNAICKIPMQLCILGLGVMMFVFYQFNQPPLLFDSTAGGYLQSAAPGVSAQQNSPSALSTTAAPTTTAAIKDYQNQFASNHELLREQLNTWLDARHKGDNAVADAALAAATTAQKTGETIREAARHEIETRSNGARANDGDYVFITFILNELPHGAIGLLVTAFFAAALSAKAAELNALAASTTMDFYRHVINKDASDEKCLKASKAFTALWGLLAIGVALAARLAENLIQAVNIIGSIFYGVMLGLFVVAFFVKRVGGTAVFWGALAAQALIFVLYFSLKISYLWYPLIGCAACVAFSLVLQTVMGGDKRAIKEPA